MNENIDQFGRTNKELKDRDILDNKHTDQSKKIKDSLAEIKEQLINENFKIFEDWIHKNKRLQVK